MSGHKPSRTDPYKNFTFRIKWDGKYVAGITRVSALKRTTEVIEIREGTEPEITRKSPGRTNFDAITLECGFTNSDKLEKWAEEVRKADSQSEPALADFRKDINIDLFNRKGKKMLSYKVFRCWVSEYQALPDMVSGANSVLIQHIRLENEGWERDTSVPEPNTP